MVSKPELDRSKIVGYGASVVALVFVGGILTLMWKFLGPTTTVMYVLAFLFGAAIIPGIIALGAPSFPMFLRRMFGDLNFVLTQLTYNIGLLVQKGKQGWKHLPGRKNSDGKYEYYDDDENEWQEIERGEENMTILGMKPFGTVWHPDEDSLQKDRIDMHARDPENPAPEKRGKFDTVAKTPTVDATSEENEFVVDIRKPFRRLKDSARIQIIEKAEEHELKNQAAEGMNSPKWAAIGAVGGIILGLMVGFILTI